MAQWPFRTAGINASSLTASALSKVACARYIWDTPWPDCDPPKPTVFPVLLGERSVAHVHQLTQLTEPLVSGLAGSFVATSQHGAQEGWVLAYFSPTLPDVGVESTPGRSTSRSLVRGNFAGTSADAGITGGGATDDRPDERPRLGIGGFHSDGHRTSHRGHPASISSEKGAPADRLRRHGRGATRPRAPWPTQRSHAQRSASCVCQNARRQPGYQPPGPR